VKKSAEDIFEPEMPIVPLGWDVLPFEQAADVVSDKGKRVKQGSYLLAGKIPVIDQGQDTIGGYTNDEDMAFDDKLPVILFGDHTRSLKYVDKPFAVGAEGVKILRPRERYVPKFFYYLLRSLQIPSRGYSRHFQFLRKFYLPLAPEEEQQIIVAEIEKQFSRLDEAVANLKRVKANLKRYKAAVLKAAVEGKLTQAWRKLHPNVEPASKLLERILAERRTKWTGRGKYKEPTAPETNNLSSLPRGWAWATVNQVATPEPNSITDGPFGSNLKTEHYKAIGPRVIRLQNIGEGLFVNEEAHISEEHFVRLQKHRIFAGDLVIAALGEDPPRACLIPQSVGHAIVKADCIRFKPHRDAMARYLNVVLNSEPTRQRAKSIVHGVGRPRLNLGEIKSIVVPLPSLVEQQQIVAEVERRLSVIEELEAAVQANLARTNRLRQSVLNQAFSGNLISTKDGARSKVERVRV
jgi:type I restriction enzyme, S subunit